MRRRILLVGVLVSTLLAVARAFQLGVLDGDEWLEQAQNQQGDTLLLPAPRGAILDRDGVPLAASQEAYRVAIAPHEVADRGAVDALLREHLHLTPRDVARALDARRRWVVLRGQHGPEVREALDNAQGVHFESVLQRFYPHGDVGRELIGTVNAEGRALGGIELELDSVLSGTQGQAVVRRDSRGHTLPGAMLRAIEPSPGRDVYLTIDYELQEIADQALRDALERTQAVSGEMLLADPATGEVLAAVSRSTLTNARSWRGVTDPYEPGSTIKPFTVAGLLARGRASLADSVYAEQGSYAMPGRPRPLTDVHGYGWLTVADALRFSSNIAIAKVGARLKPDEQYLTLRDFGFGSPTGVRYPSEAGGRLRRPAFWSKVSQSSLAIGYEIAVTPLQMVMAYAAIANGGLLLEPRLVREVRSRDGRVAQSFDARVVRRAMPTEVASALRDVLADAVETGTGTGAALGPFEVAGKTGTVRITENGRYKPGAYNASFAGFFPARDPQLVFVVKLTEPHGSYYGGLIAAPVTRQTLEAALAARSSPIDRSAIATPASVSTIMAAGPDARTLHPTALRAVDLTAAVAAPQSATMASSALPDISGMPMRDAVQRLHAAGFRVRVVGTGRVRATEPVAGAELAHDVVVRVIGERSE